MASINSAKRLNDYQKNRLNIFVGEMCVTCKIDKIKLKRTLKVEQELYIILQKLFEFL